LLTARGDKELYLTMQQTDYIMYSIGGTTGKRKSWRKIFPIATLEIG
jgi:hypothetical protein